MSTVPTKPPVHVSDDDYEVGYGKPPEHTKFKKGQSGNPKGRRPQAEPDDIDIQHLFIEELFEPVTMNTKTGPKKVPTWMAIAKRLKAECIGGNLGAIKLYKEFTDNFILISDLKKRKKEDDKRRMFDILNRTINDWDDGVGGVPTKWVEKRDELAKDNIWWQEEIRKPQLRS
jgi:Family of unknown function (DUF5681)